MRIKRLSEATDAKGRKLEIHKIYQPGPIFITKEESEGVDAIDGTLPREEGDRLAGSYVNFYIANKGIVVPVFDDPHDKAAVDTLQEAVPGSQSGHRAGERNFTGRREYPLHHAAAAVTPSKPPPPLLNPPQFLRN